MVENSSSNPNNLVLSETKLSEQQQQYLESGDFFGTFSEELKDLFAVYGKESADNLTDAIQTLQEIVGQDELENPSDPEAFEEAIDKIGLYKPIYDMDGVSYSAQKAYNNSRNNESKAIEPAASRPTAYPPTDRRRLNPVPVPNTHYDDYYDYESVYFVSENDSKYLDYYEKYPNAKPSSVYSNEAIVTVSRSNANDVPESDWYEDGERTFIRDGKKVSFTEYLRGSIEYNKNFGGELLLTLKPPLSLREYRLIKKVSQEEDVKIGVVIEAPEEVSNKQFLQEMIRILQLQKAEEISK